MLKHLNKPNNHDLLLTCLLSP